MYNVIKYTSKIFLKTFYRIHMEGSVDLPDNTGYILCANHIHMLDPAIITYNHRRKIAFMVKKELVEMPIIGPILLKSGAFPVDRSGADIKAIKTAIGVLNRKEVLAIFPEGTRHRDGVFRDIKKGAALIAIKTQSPIVPLRIVGNWKLFSKMTLRIGEPIYPNEMNKDELTIKLKKAIEALAPSA